MQNFGKLKNCNFVRKKYGSVSCDISYCIVICKTQKGSIDHFDPLNKLFSSFKLSFTLRVQIFEIKNSNRNQFFGRQSDPRNLQTCLIIWKYKHFWPLKMHSNV